MWCTPLSHILLSAELVSITSSRQLWVTWANGAFEFRLLHIPQIRFRGPTLFPCGHASRRGCACALPRLRHSRFSPRGCVLVHGSDPGCVRALQACKSMRYMSQYAMLLSLRFRSRRRSAAHGGLILLPTLAPSFAKLRSECGRLSANSSPKSAERRRLCSRVSVEGWLRSIFVPYRSSPGPDFENPGPKAASLVFPGPDWTDFKRSWPASVGNRPNLVRIRPGIFRTKRRPGFGELGGRLRPPDSGSADMAKRRTSKGELARFDAQLDHPLSYAFEPSQCV